MKPTIQNLQDTFKIGYEAFEASRKEADEIYNMFHNRQYSANQLTTLENRGQPKETFNVIKLFARMLLGYYATVVNDIKLTPTQENDIITAAILNDLVSYTLSTNNFTSEADKLKLDNILAGLMCSYVNVRPNGEKDQFGRPLYEIELSHVPVQEIVLDPMSRKEDYSDAKFIHRFKWLSEEDVVANFGAKSIEDLDAYNNHLNVAEADFEYSYGGEFQGKYKRHDNYLIVHSIIKDGDKSHSVFWSGDQILQTKEITYKKVKFPYRVQKLHSSNKSEYYGIFREVLETQKAINQALVKIQLMVNTQKAFVEDGSVENLDAFINQFNRVNAVIPVKNLAGIRVENLTREVIDQYTVIDKALDRIQRILSINDSFLGMAYASDSGKKVQLQQNASVTALKYLTSKIENFYRLLGWDILHLIQQYYTAHQVVGISDDYEGQRWLELNKPLLIPTGKVDPQTGQPQMRMVFEEVLDPETNEPMVDELGNMIMAPIPERDSEIAFTKADIEVDSVAYNAENETNQQLLEQFMNGQMGQYLMTFNPAGYAQAGALTIKNTKTKYSGQLAEILLQTGQMIQQQQQGGRVK